MRLLTNNLQSVAMIALADLCAFANKLVGTVVLTDFCLLYNKFVITVVLTDFY